MSRLRAVELPEDVVGRLYLHSMPGRWETLEDCWTAVRHAGCSRILCLATTDELLEKSPTYAATVGDGTSPVPVSVFAMPDHAAPDDIEAFAQSVTETAASLRQGAAVLIHCAAGIGRTGTYAMAVLMTLGLSMQDAETRVSKAGSYPNWPQLEALARVASLIGAGNRPDSDPSV